ncbi:MAG: phage head closure protein [Bacillota bacterium]|nr:phage head closure protein [Bacillota bacterium]
MNPGELNHYLEIQQYGNGGTDEDGFPIQGWDHLMNIWASKQGLVGRAFYAAQAVQSENDVTFRIRYVKGIKAGMKVIDGDNIYYLKVDPVDKKGDRKELYLICNNTKPSTGGE